ncbi:hypothetical protein Btru_032819 [Bulinus truncatus]|nr:hypothetical protein Btru_032819 [Bulinus truncatus]
MHALYKCTTTTGAMCANWQLAAGVVESLDKFIQEEDDVFYDFTIVVEEKQFKCHKFLLGACSLFFRGLFRSGMKETESNSVCLKEISHETFKLIRDVLYSSADIITEENIFDIWHAANQLQIPFLIKECERFVVTIISLENYDEVLEHAFLLESKDVITGISDFITANYKDCKDQETILKLNGEDFVRVIKSESLDTDTEDSVIDVIIKWLDYRYKNTRKRKAISMSTIESDLGDNMKTNSFDENESCDDFSNKDINSTEEEILKAEENQREVHDDDFKELFEHINPKDEIIMKSANENSTRDISLNEEINSTELKIDFQKPACGDGSQKVITPAQLTDLSKIDLKDDSLADDKETKLEVVNPINDKQEMTLQLNTRAKYVADILAAARLSLASEDMLIRLFKHKLVAGNLAALDTLFNATLYRNRGSVSTEWPRSTIPRKNFPNEIIVLLPMIDINIKAYSFQRFKYVTFSQCEEIKFCLNLTIAMGQIYATGYITKCHDSFAVFLLSRRKWLRITDSLNIKNPYSKESIMHLIPQSNFLYLIRPSNKLLLRLDLLSTNDFEMMSKVPTEDPIQYVISYKHIMILVFCSVKDDSSNKTMAHSYDTIGNKWTTSCSFEGLAQNMTSFERNNETYLLMSDGDIYIIQLNDQNVIDFVFVNKIWTEAVQLYGAINYDNTLHLISANRTTVLASVETLFKNTYFHVLVKQLCYTRCLCVPKSLLNSLETEVKS